MKSITMTPLAGGNTISKSGTGKSITMQGVPYGNYSVKIEQDGYLDHTSTVTVDDPTETFPIKMISESSGGEIVYNSADHTINFTTNVDNAYLHSMEVKLEPTTSYYLETDFPGDLWITNSLYIALQSKVVGGTSEVIETIGQGNFGIVTRPPVDLDGSSYPYNSSQFEDKTYTFVIRKAT